MAHGFPTRTVLLAGAVAATLTLAACGTEATTAPMASSSATSTMQMPPAATSAAATAPVATDHVAIQGFAFGPATVTVKPGTTVTWAQQDEDQHTVSADDASFASSPLLTGQTFTHTFTTPGPTTTTARSIPSCTVRWWSPTAERDDAMTHLDEAGRALIDREVDRRGFLRCASWVGAGTIWTLSGGLVAACGTALTGQGAGGAAGAPTGLYFVQISDSHIGFKGTANPDVLGSFTRAIAQVNALPQRPAFVVHTGDLTHTSTTEQFTTVKELLGTLRTPQVVVVPGEHDTVMGPKPYLDVFGTGSQGDGWASFDMGGIHFLSLNNVVDVTKLGHLGTA